LGRDGGKTMTATMLAFGIMGAPSLAQTSVIPVTDQLAQAESKLTGRVEDHNSVEQRICSLEVKLFGKKSKGDFSGRLLRIWKALGSNPSANLSNAKAPSAVPSVGSAASKPGSAGVAPASDSSESAGVAPAPDSRDPAAAPPASDSRDPAAVPAASDSTATPVVAAASPTEQIQPSVPPTDETMKLQSEVSQNELQWSAQEAELESHSDRELVARARQLDERHNIAEARQTLNHVVNRNINDADAFALLGDIAFRSGNLPDALRNYWIARNLQPTNLSFQGRVSATEELVKSRVSSYHICNYYPAAHDVRSIVNEGVRMWGVGSPDQAVLLFQHALKMDPTNINAYYNLGAISEWQGNLTQAMTYYLHAGNLLDRQKAYPWMGAMGQPTTDPTKRLVSGLARGLLGSAGIRLPVPGMTPSSIPQVRGNAYLSGGEDSTDLHSEIPQAIFDVRERMEAHVARSSVPIFSVTNPNASHTDTCDRCRILRSKTMGPD